MEYAVGRIYISRYFNSSSKKEAVEMINNLLHEFKAILSESSWIDSISKQHAMEKVKSKYQNILSLRNLYLFIFIFRSIPWTQK